MEKVFETVFHKTIQTFKKFICIKPMKLIENKIAD